MNAIADPATISYEELVRELDARQRARRPEADQGLPAPDLVTREALARADDAQVLALARRLEFRGGGDPGGPLTIYGRDNRRDIYTLHSAARRRAAATAAAFVPVAALQRQGSRFVLATQVYGPSLQMCPWVRFYRQPTAAVGTGFLVTEDVLATAGHLAVESRLWGPDHEPLVAFVFGFQMLGPERACTEIDAGDVYFPRRILHRAYTAHGPDWGLIMLDRSARGRPIAAVRHHGKVADRARLYMLGYPCGLPEKYVGGARVHENSASAYFDADLDAYEINSGSPVFNADDDVVEGVAVRGDPRGDFRFLGKDDCFVSLRLPDWVAGEACTRTTEFARFL
ncbi:trypsin-like peptidase domain-containing protein [Nannocystis sp. ILAH1]|uniref:trypsin-like serine peptidase n=1 Tax=Nannocystis sp. ILAH1 TaxID=2996789 RepID=UPI002271374C|nr:trypsin-like peptidase domain-containing protein [Nannocystis sp. ILAH1]MCY0991156.1 trypsin-like peptidase domain-containing protein [Nannocystis sp. ILAH1]